jgi:DNA-binding NtrC family response regulator
MESTLARRKAGEHRSGTTPYVATPLTDRLLSLVQPWRYLAGVWKPTVADDEGDETAEKSPDDGLALLVSKRAGVSVMRLGESRAVVIGRAAECDVVVEDESVSRRHAVLRLGAPPTIEDLGSRNGTLVRDRRVQKGEPIALQPGSVFEVGNVTLVLQRTFAMPAEARAAGPIVRSPVMERLYAMLDVVAPSALSVLLLGETGVGKEVFARELHGRSTRARGPFVPLNCAALPESILEAELFGHERGAFTGAVQARAGLFEAASGGTVFLDEIGELPLPWQVKLLRVLESGEVMRLGSTRPRTVDVRFVCATNRDLPVLVANGAFRDDLFFRINGVTITIPPLRERSEDVVALAEHFLGRLAASKGRPVPVVSPDATRVLSEHRWPGNVRELRNVVERAFVLASGGDVHAEHLLLGAQRAGERGGVELTGTYPQVPAASEPRNEPIREEIESLYRERVEDALKQTAGNQSRAAKLLGVSRRTLMAKMDAYGLERPRKGKT